MDVVHLPTRTITSLTLHLWTTVLVCIHEKGDISPAWIFAEYASRNVETRKDTRENTENQIIYCFIDYGQFV